MTDPPPSDLALVLACQLLLYGLAWLVAAIRLASQRSALLHWWLCCVLLALAIASYGGWSGVGANPAHSASLLVAACAYASGLRGMDYFLHSRPRHGRALAIGLTVCLAWLSLPGLDTPDLDLLEQDARFAQARALLLCAGAALLAPEIHRQYGRSGLIFIAAPAVVFGLLGLAAQRTSVSPWPGLCHAVLALVAQTVLTFSQVFALVSRQSRRIQHAALHDPLTGLANRLQAGQRMTFLWDYCHRSKQALAVAMMDIDHFKSVNDCLGHAAGDAVLVKVASALARHARSTDLVARYGGEEFLLVLPDTPPEQALVVIERMRVAVENEGADGGPAVTISAGLTCMTQADQRMDDVVRRADMALYQAKAAGRNCARQI